MIGLDTNLLVGYVTADDLEQWQLAAGLIEAEGQLCFLSNIVLCELVWVLRGKPYQFGVFCINPRKGGIRKLLSLGLG